MSKPKYAAIEPVADRRNITTISQISITFLRPICILSLTRAVSKNVSMILPAVRLTAANESASAFWGMIPSSILKKEETIKIMIAET